MIDNGVAIVGTNLDGMVAAMACIQAGRPFAVFGSPWSEGPDRSWLEAPIPGIHPVGQNDGFLVSRRDGVRPAFVAKAYQGHDHGPTIWDIIKDEFPQAIWRSQAVWDMGIGIPVQGIQPLAALMKEFGLVIVADHPQMMCQTNHQFLATSAWLCDLPMTRVSDENQRRELDGTRDRSWFLTSDIFGVHETWFAGENKPPYPGARRETIPLYTTCECGGDRVLRVGTQGAWSNSIQVAPTFESVSHWLGQNQQPDAPTPTG